MLPVEGNSPSLVLGMSVSNNTVPEPSFDFEKVVPSVKALVDSI